MATFVAFCGTGFPDEVAMAAHRPKSGFWGGFDEVLSEVCMCCHHFHTAANSFIQLHMQMIAKHRLNSYHVQIPIPALRKWTQLSWFPLAQDSQHICAVLAQCFTRVLHADNTIELMGQGLQGAQWRLESADHILSVWGEIKTNSVVPSLSYTNRGTSADVLQLKPVIFLFPRSTLWRKDGRRWGERGLRGFWVDIYVLALSKDTSRTEKKRAYQPSADGSNKGCN